MTRQFTCDCCETRIDPYDQYGILYDNEQYYPHVRYLCEGCKMAVLDATSERKSELRNQKREAARPPFVQGQKIVEHFFGPRDDQ